MSDAAASTDRVPPGTSRRQVHASASATAGGCFIVGGPAAWQVLLGTGATALSLSTEVVIFLKVLDQALIDSRTLSIRAPANTPRAASAAASCNPVIATSS